MVTMVIRNVRLRADTPGRATSPSRPEFHPSLTVHGIHARFIDLTTGRDVCPASHGNQIPDYVMGAARRGNMPSTTSWPREARARRCIEAGRCCSC